MRSDLADLLRGSGSLTELNWERVTLDVTPFLEDAREVELVTRENALALL